MLPKSVIKTLLGGIIVAGINMIMASSASAVVFTLTLIPCKEGANVAFCWAETETGELLELEGEQSMTLSGGVAKLITATVSIECKTTKGSGIVQQISPLEPNAKTTIKEWIIAYEGCVITAPAAIVVKCTIPANNETKKLKGELLTVSELLIKPAVGANFMTITFASAAGQVCPAAIIGAKNVTGEQQLEIQKPEEHELTKSGKTIPNSKLEFFAEKAKLEQSFTMSFPGLGSWVDISKEA